MMKTLQIMNYAVIGACLMLHGFGQEAVAAVFDCVGSSCLRIEIAGDTESTLPIGKPSPLRGFADASIRQDLDSSRLWMAYSWPGLRVDTSAGKRAGRAKPQVDIHLAYSDDGGKLWRYQERLLSPTAVRSPDGKSGHMSHEVVNLLPVKAPEGTQWYGAWLEYFLPDEGGFRRRPPQSFRIVISRAASPQALADAPSARLGSSASGPTWGLDANLAALSPETRHCMLWNEPALYHDGRELFLALSCMAFHGRTPDLPNSELVVFATQAQGDPAGWHWRYAGKLAGFDEARELGGERLTQIDLAMSRDGRLLAVVTPDTWDTTAHDFVHHGCRIVEVEKHDDGLRFARDANGVLKLRAAVMASDAGPAGTAACTYDPASATGIVLTKRDKAGGLGGGRGNAHLTATLHATGVHP